ncbi:hypothetical protein MYX19_01570 [Nitrospinae bacterium AH-259-F20]|nr:hypothetical protein [Nitrospinae bacterium AH-259-F20]
MNSDAWRSLSFTAVTAYINIYYNLKGKTKKKEIVCTHSTLKNPMAKSTWRKATVELIDKGFIDMVQGSSGHCRQPNVYGLSERWRLWSTPRFVPGDTQGLNSGGVLGRLWKEEPEKMGRSLKKGRKTRARRKQASEGKLS